MCLLLKISSILYHEQLHICQPHPEKRLLLLINSYIFLYNFLLLCMENACYYENSPESVTSYHCLIIFSSSLSLSLVSFLLADFHLNFVCINFELYNTQDSFYYIQQFFKCILSFAIFLL